MRRRVPVSRGPIGGLGLRLGDRSIVRSFHIDRMCSKVLYWGFLWLVGFMVRRAVRSLTD